MRSLSLLPHSPRLKDKTPVAAPSDGLGASLRGTLWIADLCVQCHPWKVDPDYREAVDSQPESEAVYSAPLCSLLQEASRLPLMTDCGVQV